MYRVHRGMVVVMGALCALFWVRSFFFNGCTAEKLMRFCPPVYCASTQA